ncbi:MAG: putative Ig domain-containing protein, partial [Solirubrobacteraceae bacterium]
VVGLEQGAGPRPLLVRPPRTRTRAIGAAGARAALRLPHVATGGAQPCATAQRQASAQRAYTADQIASAYGFSGAYEAGDRAAGVTVAVYELEGVDPSDIAAYQACYGTDAAISYIPVDGGAGPGPGSGEAALDIENLIGLAPSANVLVYQGPNSSSGNPGSGPYDTYSAIINQDRARVVTVSWGQCEQTLGEADALAENTLFEQAAVQGQSIVAASGDSGSEDCYDPSAQSPRTYKAVDDPSSQPFVTGVGGTSLTALGPRPSETVWNGAGNAWMLASQPGASGGGLSIFWAMPPAQSQAASTLGVRSPLDSGSTCGDPGGLCREVPDVAADADPSTGYLVYWNGAGSIAGQPAGWQALGGTSGAAPVWAAILALADASGGCAQSGVGYADPALYRAAGADYAGDFNDVTSGDNDYTGTNGGLYPAGMGYDMATGLGTPNAAPLVAALCGDGVGLVSPGEQRTTLGASVLLALHATDVAGAVVGYRASGLPLGLRIDPRDGVVSGHPRRTGTFKVRVVARDQQRSTASVSFEWTIAQRPRIFDVTLSPGPRLSFRIAAGRGGPGLATVRITLPAGLRLRALRGVTLTASGSDRPAFAERKLGSRALLLSLARASSRIHVTIGAAGLAGSTHGPPKVVRLMVTVIDSSSGDTRLQARVRTPG